MAVASQPITAEPLEQFILTNTCGLVWELQRFPAGWTLGRVTFNGKPVAQPLTKGMIMLRDRTTGEEHWLAPVEGKAMDRRTARFTGRHKVGEVTLSYQMDVTLMDDLPAARLLPRWSVDEDFAGQEVCLAWQDVGDGPWRCTIYPWAGNATNVSRERLTYCGVPAAILFRPDLSLVTLFGIAPDFDYLNPTTWTGDTGFDFRDGATPPQFRVGGGKLKAGVDYQLPLQLFLSDAGNSADAITALVRNWIKVNRYRVEPLKVRSHQEGFDLFVQGRRKGRMWMRGWATRSCRTGRSSIPPNLPSTPGSITSFTNRPVMPPGANAPSTRMDFMLKAQHTDTADPHSTAQSTPTSSSTRKSSTATTTQRTGTTRWT